MRKYKEGLVVLFLVALFAAPILIMADTPRVRPQLSPLMQEVEAVLAAENAALLVLEQDLKAAPSEREALGILRAIGQRKQDSEIAILRIQERYAREAGNEEAAAILTETIEKILNPTPIAPKPEKRVSGGQDHE